MRHSFWRNAGVLASLALLLGGCVQVFIVGHTEDWSEYMTGEGNADPLVGVGNAQIRLVKLNVTCTGQFKDYAPGKARGELMCSDGRVIKTDSVAVSMSRGKGQGIDQYGNRGVFEFFTGQAEYEQEVEAVKAEVARRNLDVAHLRVPAAPANGYNKSLPPSAAPSATPAPSAVAPAPAVISAQPPTVAGGGDRRLALVIGNATYRDAPLKNPVNDARALSAKLRALGFEVMTGENLGQRDMTRLIARFGERLTGRDVGMFFFAGHGIQVKGKNYLIPVDAQIGSENSVRAEAVDVDAVLDQLAASPLNLVILDACRNNPFERRFRGVGGGLAQMEAPKGTLIAYATAPGKVAMDGEGDNSTYTTALLRVLGEPNLPVETVFKRVRGEVARMSGDAQVPWEASSLTGDFYFARQAAPAAAETASGAGGGAEAELLFWQSVKDSPHAEDLQAYLRQYPNGRFAEIAKNRLSRIKK